MERECTDFFWLILMICTFVGVFGVAVYALATGDPHKMIAPYDGAGNLCGFDEGYTDYKYMYMTDLNPSNPTSLSGVTASGVCVKSCPTSANLKD